MSKVQARILLMTVELLVVCINASILLKSSNVSVACLALGLFSTFVLLFCALANLAYLIKSEAL